jgi:predicted ATPase with chaperone activity
MDDATMVKAMLADTPFPLPPRTAGDLGIPATVVADIALKVLYFHGAMRGDELADHLCVPFDVFEPALAILNEAAHISSGGMGRSSHAQLAVMAAVEWHVSRSGQERARELMAINQYAGPVPVPIDVYATVARAQAAERPRIAEEDVRAALDDLVLADEVIERLGAALNGDHPLFLHGAPGNGKSSIADRLATLLGPPLYVPRSLYAHGEVVRFFNPVYHRPIVDPEEPDHDRRWVLVERPAVKVGGELSPHSLELSFDRELGFYEASAQLKANGGILVVDDFGRQSRIPANELLNRLIVPLGSGVDYLNIARAATTITVPFTTRLVLATNLRPEELMDEAFLRRIRVKVHVPEPTENQYREIWRRTCERNGLMWRPDVIDELIVRRYRESARPFRGVHPADLVAQVISLARFRDHEPELSSDLLAAACRMYFLDRATPAADD